MMKPLVLSVLLLVPSIATAIQCVTSQCFANVYGDVDPESSPTLSRVETIYQKLTRTVGTQQAVRSKLMIIESNGFPWAVALGDNTVVVTTGAIERLYREQDFSLGDARTAFILGHELSHLATDDLFHHRYFLFNSGSTFEKPKPRPDEELRADLRGYTIATLAGYETDRLLNQQDDFFRTWLVQISDPDSVTHPGSEARRDNLKERFQNILNDVPYYEFAVALAHFGYYKDAELLLEDSLNRVETVEAYSNLGYVYLQIARERMPADLAYRYWFPTLLEPRNTLDGRRGRSLFESGLPDQALKYLEKAEQRLKYAISLDENQLTNHINLATVYMYMPNRLHRANAAIQDARLTPLGKNPAVREQLESLNQLIRVSDDYDAAEDQWRRARDKMVELADKRDATENLLFNFARMLDIRGRDNTAEQYWQRLYQQINTLPPSYQIQVCNRLRKSECGKEQRDSSPWDTAGIPLGKDIRTPVVRKFLSKNWGGKLLPAKRLPSLDAQVFTNDSGDSLIALDNHIEMMIVRNIPPRFKTTNSLITAFGNPEVTLPVDSGYLLSFADGWSVLVVQEEVKEIWIAEL